jgi:hypothetical protein
MRSFVVALSLILASGASVHPADRPACTSLKKAQKAAGKDTTIIALTPAQFHFLQGMYVAMPTTPEGLPPGDGALILTRDKSDDGMIIWTRGFLACQPLPVGHMDKLLKILGEVKAGAGADGDDL